MSLPAVFINMNTPEAAAKAKVWHKFLAKNNFDYDAIEKIDFKAEAPIITDSEGNKFSIDFFNDKKNYHKKKLSLKKELLSKALGAGKHGFKVLDLSAGLGIDAVFLAQLGYEVTAIERNPLIFLCLQSAAERSPELNITFRFDDSLNFLKQPNMNADAIYFDVIYFDPMFPEKAKSALPRQEMVFFKSLVGADGDAAEVLQQAVKTKNIKRVVVKRPLKAPLLKESPAGCLKGKIVRFDIYGAGK